MKELNLGRILIENRHKRRIPAIGCFSNHSAYPAYRRTVYRDSLDERLDSALPQRGLCHTRLDSFAEIYGTVHL